MHKFRWSLIVFLWLTSPSLAAPPKAPQTIKLTYKAYWGGFVISKVYGAAQLDPGNYQVDISYEVTGLAAIFSKAHNSSSARGIFTEDGTLTPLSYESEGGWSKNSYRNKVRFRKEDGKIISHDQDFKFREEVKYIPIRDDLKYGPDLISFYLGLMFQDPPLTNWPELRHQNVFGGFFLFDIAYRCPGMGTLDSRRAIYRGKALVCEFSDRIIDGRFERLKKSKKKKKKAKKEKQPDPVKIWFARVGDLDAMIPVYSKFAVGWGNVRVYLSEIEVIPGPDQRKAS